MYLSSLRPLHGHTSLSFSTFPLVEVTFQKSQARLSWQSRMRFSSLAWAFVPALLVNSEKLDIPEVDKVVQGVLHDYSKYVHYTAPANATNSTGSRNSTQGPAASGQAYWYEGIQHQGISAFGPSGYVVYRNVKDYGARGMQKQISVKTIMLKWTKAMVPPMIRRPSTLLSATTTPVARAAPQAARRRWLSTSQPERMFFRAQSTRRITANSLVS